MTNLRRKAFHLSGVLITVIYLGLDIPRPIAAGLLAGIAAALLLVDLLRYRLPGMQARFRALFGAILDEKDFRGLNGSTLYFAGCAATVALFRADPACAGLLSLALGDPAAAIIGSSVRSPRLGRVSAAGSGACLVVATLACRAFFPWPAALLGGAVAALAEALAGSKLDNLAIPLAVALTLNVP